MTKPTDDVQKALDALYGARPSAFVALRKKLATELKSAGDRDASTAVLAARRPTATAWAMNHVVRENPKVMARFLDAVSALRGAQRKLLGARSPGNSSGSGDRAALNEVIGELLNLAREALESEDVAWNPATQRRIATSLRTFPMANAANQNRFLKGLLEKDLDTADDDTLLQTTLGLADDEVDARPATHHAPAKSPAPDLRERERKKKEEADAARRGAEELERRTKARDRKADELDRQADRLEARAKEAEASAKRARSLADSARTDAEKVRAEKP
jgi:hypothetical protein